MSFLSPKMPAMPSIPTPPPPPPAFGQIQGSKPTKKSMTPTFLGAGVIPPSAPGPTLMGGGTTQKTLLGQ